MKRIAIFASGNGSNAENIIQYFKADNQVSVELILTNNAKAKVLERADRLHIESKVFGRNDFYHSDLVVNILKDKSIDFIVLAGFMWLVPENLISAYPDKILNIHPALLPKYGGKGMYGDFVHQAVSDAGETVTGISIHYVNAHYDEGSIVFQKEIAIEAGEDPDSIAKKIHELEYEYFPKLIDQLLKS